MNRHTETDKQINTTENTLERLHRQLLTTKEMDG